MRIDRQQRSFLAGAALVCALALSADLGAANLLAGNGVYQVVVTDGSQVDKCGTWTASTRKLHSAGPGLSLLALVNGQFPIDLNFTSLHSYYTHASYSTGEFGVYLCVVAGPPQIEPILRDGVVVGYRHRWTFVDQNPQVDLIGSSIELTQEIVVEGPVDGSETVENSAVRETHIVTNLGPDRFRFGLRKFWDLLVAGDWGPAYGDCENPTAACDRSANMPPVGPRSYPRNIVFNPSPEVAACSAGQPPNEPEGCGQPAPYLVSATVRPPSTLDPPPSAPDVLQFNAWNYAVGRWFSSGLNDDSECEPDDVTCFPPFDENCGTALAYYYGVTRQTAPLLLPGESRSFTQYLGAFTDSCPELLTDVQP